MVIIGAAHVGIIDPAARPFNDCLIGFHQRSFRRFITATASGLFIISRNLTLGSYHSPVLRSLTQPMSSRRLAARPSSRASRCLAHFASCFLPHFMVCSLLRCLYYSTRQRPCQVSALWFLIFSSAYVDCSQPQSQTQRKTDDTKNGEYLFNSRFGFSCPRGQKNDSNEIEYREGEFESSHDLLLAVLLAQFLFTVVWLLNRRPQRNSRPQAWNQVISGSPKIVGMSQSQSSITGRLIRAATTNRTRIPPTIRPITFISNSLLRCLYYSRDQRPCQPSE